MGAYSARERNDTVPIWTTLAALRLGSGLRFRSISAGGDLSCAVAINGDGYCCSSEAANVRAPLSKAEPLAPTIPIVRVAGRLEVPKHQCGLERPRLRTDGKQSPLLLGRQQVRAIGRWHHCRQHHARPRLFAPVIRQRQYWRCIHLRVTFDGATHCWGRRGQNAAHSTAATMQVAALGESPAAPVGGRHHWWTSRAPRLLTSSTRRVS